MRKLSMMNSLNDVFEFNANSEFIAVDLEGLGIEIDNTFESVNVNRLVTDKRDVNGTISFSLLKGDLGPQDTLNFKKLATFLNHPPYQLIYENEDGIYNRDCLLAKITKSDMTLSDDVSESVELECLTPWYRWIYEEKEIAEYQDGLGKIYNNINSDKNYVTSYKTELMTADMTATRREIATLNTTLATIAATCELSLSLSIIFGSRDVGWYIVSDSAGNKAGEIFIQGSDKFNQEYRTTLKFSPSFVGTKLYIQNFVGTTANAEGIKFNNVAVVPYQNQGAYGYPYIYAGVNQGDGGVFSLTNNSVYIGLSDSSPVEIEITGPAKNPEWDVVIGSRVVYSDGFDLTIPEFYRLVVSSNPTTQQAVLIAPDGTTSSVYKQQNLSKSNYVRIPVGHSKILFKNVENVKFKYREEKVVV